MKTSPTHLSNGKFLNLDSPVIKFSETNPKDFWTLRDAVRGVQIFGGIGSGKTSGSGRMIAKSFLQKGFGGLVLCAKPDERENWEKLAEAAGRSDDLIVFKERSPYRFNPLDYETTRGEGAGQTFNLVNLFMNIYQMGRILSGEGMSSSGERFWDNAMKRCMGKMIDLLKLAGEKVSISNMHSLVTSTLSKDEQETMKQIRQSSDRNKAVAALEKWAEDNFYVKCLFRATINLNKPKEPSEQQSFERDYQLVRNYFDREFANLHDRTKTIITESFLGIAEPFLSGLLYEHFAKDTNIKPEWTHERGSIIILDFPVKNYLEAGVYAQGIFKLLWQQAIERRNFKDGVDRPVFLWVDESQMFLNDYDQIFQTTARSSGACTVFLSQNISNYYAAIGGRNPTPKVDSLLGNLSTKIFHANNDAVTNEWAANTIGKDTAIASSYSINKKDESIGGSEQFQQYQVKPIDFTKLLTGGAENDLEVEAIITVAGKIWSNGKNYWHTFIPQNL